MQRRPRTLAEFGDSFVLLFGTSLGAIVSSFAGFAFSPVAGIVMVGALPPQQLVALLMLCSIPVQLATLIHARRALVPRDVGLLLLGGAVGVPLAVVLLRRLDADAFQVGFGLFLAFYALLMLCRRARECQPRGGPLCEAAVGFVAGVVGGLTAMPGAIPVLYCDLRGQSKEAQRALVQPFIPGDADLRPDGDGVRRRSRSRHGRSRGKGSAGAGALAHASGCCCSAACRMRASAAPC